MSSVAAWTFGSFADLVGALPAEVFVTAYFVDGRSRKVRIHDFCELNASRKCWSIIGDIDRVAKIYAKSSPNYFSEEEIAELERSPEKKVRDLASVFLGQAIFHRKFRVIESISTLTIESKLPDRGMLDWCKGSLSWTSAEQFRGILYRSNAALDVVALMAPNPWQFPRLQRGWPQVNGGINYLVSLSKDNSSCSNLVNGICYLEAQNFSDFGESIEIKMYPDPIAANRMYYGKYRDLVK